MPSDNEAELRELLRSAHEQLAERDDLIERLRRDLATLQKAVEAREYFEWESRQAHERLAEVEQELREIKHSRAWRLVTVLRGPKGARVRQ